jgi:iron complex outermembrane recepter protein
MSATIRARASMRCGLLLTSVAFAALASGGVSYAQDNSDANANGDEIVVTGSRIPRPGFVSNSPVSTVGQTDINLEQPTDVEAVLHGLPQFSPGNNQSINNGSSGTSTLDLRGLTEPRTLVLINGKRMVGFNPNGLFDVTAVPIALLDRVDVVTGGASAVYGSDAMAGVVNFILKDDFQGVQIDQDYSVTDHGDGERDSTSITMGANFDDNRGNVTLNVSYLNREQVGQSRGPATLTPGASSTTTPVAVDSAEGDRTQVSDSGELVPFYHGFDFNPQNLYQAPQERWGATALAHYDLNENLQAYSRFIFAQSITAPALASSGTFGNAYAVPLDSPFLTAQARDYLAANNPVDTCANTVANLPVVWTAAAPAGNCVAPGLRWRAADLGPRQYTFEYDTFQTLVGLKGTFFGWDWDVSGAHGETSLKREQGNDLDSNKFQQALFATSTTTCFDGSNFCAPLNLFNPATPTSQASLDFIRLNLFVQSLTTQDYVTATITGDLGDFKSPFASSPIAASFGAEYRDESTDYRPDAASQAGISPGFGATLPVKGEYDVKEYFGEALVPLIENAPLIDFINLELGYRSSDYSTSGNVSSYKYGAEWQPVGGLRFRGMFQRAVRAANLAELFTPITPGTGDLLTDPCASGTATNPIPVGSDLYNLCLATGAPAGRLDGGNIDQPTSGQVNNFAGGNPNLTPEKADTVTLGFVAQPSFVSGLTVTVDYYDIDIKNAISVRPAFDLIDACYSPTRNADADPTIDACTRLIRNPTVGNLEGATIYGVVQQTENIGSVHTKGVDFSVTYDFDLGTMGSVNVAFDGTHLTDLGYEPSAGAATIDCLGHYGKLCGLPSTVSASTGGPEPENRWVQRTVWTLGPVDLAYRWRHLDSTTVDPKTAEDAIIAGSPIDDVSAKIPSYDYLDLSAAWQVTDIVRLNFNVTNVTNKDAPFVATETGSTTFNSGNTYPATYDVLGRVFTLGVSAKF